MADTDFDVIVVGAGIAGSSCALLCARAGLRVLLLERGPAPGSKNLSGGRIYEYALHALFPEGFTGAPLDREITLESLNLLTADSSVSVNYQHAPPTPPHRSWSVQRARFDAWLAAQAGLAGAELLCDAPVERLLGDASRIRGVELAGECFTADQVVLAEGANTLLAEGHGLCPRPPTHAVGLGIKQTLALPAADIEARFGLEPGHGAAWLFSGGGEPALPAGGFLYTHASTLSLGMVAPLSSLQTARLRPADALERLRQHPRLRPLLRDTEAVEYGAHLVPEGGLKALPPRLAGPGWWLVGDAARLCINTGLTVRGMDMAITSALAAAQCLIAGGSDDPNARYRDALRQHGLLATLNRYQQLPALLARPGWYQRYPELACAVMQESYRVGPLPPARLAALCWRHGRRHGIRSLLRDLWEAGRCL